MSWLRRSTLVFAVVAYLLLAVLMPYAERRLFGVRPGVTVDRVQVGGWLPRDVNRLLEQIAVAVDRPPRPAVLNKLTGAVLPARPGVRLDVAATAAAVRSAPAGASVRLVLQAVAPDVTAAAFAGPARTLARVAAPPGALALNNVVVLPRHPFVLAADCPLAATLQRAARSAGLPAGRAAGSCRVQVRNDTADPLVLRAGGGVLEILRYGR